MSRYRADLSLQQACFCILESMAHTDAICFAGLCCQSAPSILPSHLTTSPRCSPRPTKLGSWPKRPLPPTQSLQSRSETKLLQRPRSCGGQTRVPMERPGIQPRRSSLVSCNIGVNIFTRDGTQMLVCEASQVLKQCHTKEY